MRVVLLVGAGKLALNFQWLPTWLGMNGTALAAIEEELRKKAVGLEATEDVLDEINEVAIEAIVKKHPVEGLRDYLDGLKFVRID